jgi:hypothetical protein
MKHAGPVWRTFIERAHVLRAAGARAVQRARTSQGVRVGLRVAATLLALAATTTVFLLLNKQFFYAKAQYDEEFFTWGGWCIRRGLVPYRDFIEFKPPMVFLTHALAQALFGLENYGFRTFFTVFPLAATLAFQLALIARGVGRALATGAVIALVSIFVHASWHDTALTDSESIGLSYYLIGLALLLWEPRHIKLTTAAGGAFMSLCVLSKEPFLPIVAVSWLGMFWLRGRPDTLRASRVLYARYSLLGVGVVALMLLAYMVPTGALAPYLEMASHYSRMYRDPTRSYCVMAGWVHPAPTWWGNVAQACARIRGAFLNEATLAFLGPFILPGAIFACVRRRPLFLCMLGAAAAALWAPTASNCMWRHYYNMSLAGVAFILAASLESIATALAAADARLRMGVGVAALMLSLIHVGPDLNKQREAKYVRSPWPEPQPGLLAFIKANTTRDDRIFTTGTPALYAHADRVSAVRETNIIDQILGLYDGNTDEEKLRPIREQLVKNRPKIVFIDPEHEPRKQRHYRALVKPFLAELKYRQINDRLYLLP